ncbi:MAG: MAPEG family protein [Pseudomonadota bacterium]
MPINMSVEILQPVVVLVGWSMVMWIWMYVTRLPAVQAAGMQLDSSRPRGEQMATLPPRVRWKADNYNHLMEQPTIFYPLVIVIALLGQGEGLNLYMAWAYVILRIVHSLFQALNNTIMVRFVLHVLSSIPLFVMIWSAFMAF